MKLVGAAAGLVLLCALSQAHAVCIYNGKEYAKTTIEQEFNDSKWVVKAKVLAAEDHFSDNDESWTLYRIEVQHAYKGHPEKRLQFFTFRDSGGFYMDRPWVDLPAGHDIGGDYLLFLNPNASSSGLPPVATGTVSVNYNCGVSRAWANVSASDQSQLSYLEHRQHRR